MENYFKNKTVLITGANGDIGLSICKYYYNLGSTVIALSSGKTKINNFLLNKKKIHTFSIDFSQPNSISEGTKNILKLFPKINILINNAGINTLKKVTQIDYVSLKNLLDINLVSHILFTKLIISNIPKNKDSSIINISSIWSIKSRQSRSMYSISKQGINAYTRSLALELAEFKIRANSISPGFISTKLTSKTNTKNQLTSLTNQVPFKRLGTTDEIAKLVIFLTSSDSSYITGQNIVIDGGFTL